MAGRQQNGQEIVTFVGQDGTAFDMILLTGGKADRTKSPEEQGESFCPFNTGNGTETPRCGAGFSAQNRCANALEFHDHEKFQ